MALTKVSTDGVKDDAVTTDKLANAINTERTANTAKASITINNNADNRVITGSGTANTLEGESNLTFSGGATGDATLTVHAEENNNASEAFLKLEVSNDFAESIVTAHDSSGVGGSLKYNHGDNAWRFTTNGDSERLRIDSSGNVGIGTTSPDRLLHVSKAGPDVVRIQQSTNNQGSNHACISLVHAAATASAQGVGMVFVNASGSDVGSIRFGSSTSYNTSSDYRLKENVTPISDGITRLKILKPSRFNFKIDKDTTVDGFLAHEVTAVPEAITGTKDEVDSDNNPVYQGIDQSKLVPLLTAALQEAIAKIEVLETKVAALEAA